MDKQDPRTLFFCPIYRNVVTPQLYQEILFLSS